MRRGVLLLLLMLSIAAICIVVDGCSKSSGIVNKRDMPLDCSWHRDILPGYEARHVDQGIAFDGPCRSTIIRRIDSVRHEKGYLYVHGFNDYFFQQEMGDRIADAGYGFYAVDLRRYGRSLEPWQYHFNVRDIREYFADIDSAIAQMHRDGINEIVLSGHSTGGLTVILYGENRGVETRLSRIVTDSPFLEWNFNGLYRSVIIPTVKVVGGILPNVKIPQSKCDGYAYSLLSQYYGEWEYNTAWKLIYSPPVTCSWVGAIERGQKEVISHAEKLQVPVLIMHSSRKIDGCHYAPEFKTGDCVLDPIMLQSRGEEIRNAANVGVQLCVIDSGLHDLILSPLPVRQRAYEAILEFIR